MSDTAAFPDPASMSPAERKMRIDSLRDRVREHPNKDDPEYPSDDELKYGIACLRIMRAGSARAANSGTKGGASVKPLTLDDF